MNLPKPSAIFPAPAGNSAVPSAFERLLITTIDLELEAGDPDNYADGLQKALQLLRTFYPPPALLDGLYEGPQGLGDAIAALAQTVTTEVLYQNIGAKFRVTVVPA